MKREALSILSGYFSNQIEIIYKIIEDIKSVSPNTREETSHLGYLLHNLYCAIEDLFQEIAKTFENNIEDLSKYHRELLKRMHIEIPSIRPKLLSNEAYTLLDELRGFRHIFRHSYDYELSSIKVENIKEKVLNNWNNVQKDLNFFKEFLERTIEN
ncbi:MAG: hypothetical protein HY934_10905 [Candidatus Firestonebacteria bacterium]|nr:hypothetical protein [Candidatus Firestonebacteria bacterium]